MAEATDLIPSPDMYDSWQDWARQVERLLTSGNVGAGIGLPILDGLARPIVDVDGVYAYGPTGVPVIIPDLIQIDTADLVDAAITTNKIANLAVDTVKLAALSVEAAKLATAAVTEDKLGAGAVTATKIGALAVGTAAIQALAVGTAQIANLAVTEALIGNLAVTDAKINDLSANKINVGTLSADRIGANSITASKIAALTLTADEIAANTLTSAKYLELRNTMVISHHDSLDSTHDMDLDFPIVAELNNIVSIKVSYKIKPYRAYSTGAASGGSSTPTSSSGGGQTPTTTATTVPNHTHIFSVPNAAGSTALHYRVSDNKITASGSGGPFTPTSSSADGHTHTFTIISDVTNVNRLDVSDGGVMFAATGSGLVNTNTTNNHVHQLIINEGSSDRGLNVKTVSGVSFGASGAGGNLLMSQAGSTHTHNVTIAAHDHTVTIGNHTHDLTYNISEETNSPTINLHADNGSGYGVSFFNSAVDQLEKDITAQYSGTGFKGLSFRTNQRCRIHAVLVLKLDIDA